MNQLQHIHPPCWWAGMKYSKIQLLLHGPGIGQYQLHLKDARGVYLTSFNAAPNPNYLLAYIQTEGAPAQTLHFVLWKEGEEDIPFEYELKEREHTDVQTFDASDVVYLLMPDRWIMGDSAEQKQLVYQGMKESTWDIHGVEKRHGGDLAGMQQGLDYLRNLGVTSIWPTAMLCNDNDRLTYHGYAITDYYRIDPRLGTNEEYRAFVEAAHEKGMKVIKDIVFNHCGVSSFLFEDRPDDDWFNYNSQFTPSEYKTGSVADSHAACIDKELTVDGWFTNMMPDVNGKNRYFADYLIQVTKWWVEYAGIDGIRQDTYPYNDFDFMRRWCMEMEDQYPGFNIVGETWVNNNVGVSYWQKDSKLAAPRNSELKTVMDFPLMSVLNACVDEETDEWFCGLARVYNYISQDIVYADVNHLLTFLANHDTDRFQPTKEKAKDLVRYKQALTLLLTLRGIPQLYVGDEIGMYANKNVNDGALRQDFPGGWREDKNNAFTAKGRTPLQNKYFDFSCLIGAKAIEQLP